MGFGFIGGVEVHRKVEKIPRKDWDRGLQSAFQGAPKQSVAYLSTRGMVVISFDPDFGYRMFIAQEEMPEEIEILTQELEHAEALTAMLLG